MNAIRVVAAVLAAAVAMSASAISDAGIENSVCKEVEMSESTLGNGNQPPPAGVQTSAGRHRHLKVTAWDLRDRTDDAGDLVEKREWMLLPGTKTFELTCPVAEVEDVLSGEGTVYIRLAPLPGSRTWDGADFRVTPDSLPGLVACDRPAPCVAVNYSGGFVGRQKALIAAQRKIRPCIPGRDGLFLSNTWGDRNRDTRICESFMLKEIDAAAAIGVDVMQIDDGWQKGRTANSADAPGDGAWGAYWAKDSAFWRPDPVRFPNGLGPVVAAAKAKGIGIGLWFGPDSSGDAENWERDAETILGYHREYGIDCFKIDSMKTASSLSLERQAALFAKVLEKSGGKVVFDLDVTAGRRPGYFGLPAIGPVFVENRYTDWHKYWPHLTLRQFWSLAHVVDPVRLRMEMANPRRNAGKYEGDPLAPGAWPVESIFASVMLSSPLGWFECSGLDADTVERLAPFVAKWKEHRGRMHGGVVHPAGARPDGVSWTGFVVTCEDGGGYALFFRELAPTGEFEFDLAPYVDAKSVAVLSPRGTAALQGSLLKMRADKLDFVWARLQP